MKFEVKDEAYVYLKGLKARQDEAQRNYHRWYESNKPESTMHFGLIGSMEGVVDINNAHPLGQLLYSDYIKAGEAIKAFLAMMRSGEIYEK